MPRREPQGLVEGVGLAGPARRQVLDREQTHPRVALGELARDLGCPVGATIVYDQDLEVRIVLPADRAQAVGQVQLFVLGGKDADTKGGSGWSKPGEALERMRCRRRMISITSRRIGQIATITA